MEPNYPQIVGNWINGRNDYGCQNEFPKFNPHNGRMLGVISKADTPTIRKAVELSINAMDHWAHTGVIKRSEILRNAVKIMEARQKEIASIVAVETGKSFDDAMGETAAAIELGYFMAGEGRRYYGQTIPSAVPNRTAYTIRQPSGLCLLITSFNTPIANVAWKTFPALLCGNAAIMKPSEYTPLTAVLMARIFQEAGLPDNVLQIIQGNGETGKLLVETDEFDLVSFTGSIGTGRYISEISGKKLRKNCLELGGKNPLIVCDDADLNSAADAAVMSAFSNAGQRCASGSRIIVFESVFDEFRSLFLKKTSEFIVGPVISLRQLEGMIRAINESRDKYHSTIAIGGKRRDCPGYYLEPTILESISPDDPISNSELFGPITCLYKAIDLRQAVQIANSVQFGLTGAIHTKSINRMQFFIENYRSGVVSVNGPTYGSEPHMPFGGPKNSGNGWREPGLQALDFYSELKAVYVKHDPEQI